VSRWVVTPFLPADLERARTLAKLSGSGFDPGAESERSWAKVWIARAAPEGVPLGLALTWRAADEVHLLDLAVDPDARRRGIGRALLEAVLVDARTSGAALALLEVRAQNAQALALYAALGFVQTGVRRAYYSDNGEDAVVMRLDLSSCAIGDPR
jgi:ribosomal-protein-alanine N-acetyltransferase